MTASAVAIDGALAEIADSKTREKWSRARSHHPQFDCSGSVGLPPLRGEGAGVHAAACRTVGTVLGPEANRAHRNHRHVDMAEMAERTTGAFCEQDPDRPSRQNAYQNA